MTPPVQKMASAKSHGNHVPIWFFGEGPARQRKWLVSYSFTVACDPDSTFLLVRHDRNHGRIWRVCRGLNDGSIWRGDSWYAELGAQ